MPLILITGPSASGKTTLARMVGDSLGLPVFSQDDYYRKDAPPIFTTFKGTTYRTYERPELFDIPRLVADLPSPTNAVIEGFLLFYYPDLLKLSTHRFYLDVPFPKLVLRRKARNHRRDDPQHTWYKIGQQETLQFVEPQKETPNTIVLDGMQPSSLLLDQILTRVL